MVFDVNDTAPDTPAPRELSQDVQTLVNNSLDFLNKAREESKVSKPKLSVANFWTVVEILLKTPLTHEHRSLACSLKKPIKKQVCLAGDFQSITYEETRKRLKDILEKPLDRETDSISGKVRKRCNHVVHFYHPASTEAEQHQVLKEQADTWFVLNRLLRDKWEVIFGVRHNQKLASGETRLIKGNKFYAEVRFKQVEPELERFSEENVQIGSCNECHQHATITGTETAGDKNRRLEVTRCKICTNAVKQVTLVYPDCGIPQLLPEGDSDLKYGYCGYTSDRYKLLGEELFHSVDEQLLSVFPTGCTNYMTPESVCKSGDGCLCTRYFIYYTEPHICGYCGHLSDSALKPNHIRGCEFCDGD